MANRLASDRQAANAKSAGINFRWVRSPDAPKITIAQGSASATELRASRTAVSAISCVMDAMSSSSYKCRSHATLRQRCAQLCGRAEEYRGHTQSFGGFEIRGAVIYKDAFLRRALRDSQRKLVDQRIGLTSSQIARGKKGGEVPGQIEFADAVAVQLLGFVVESSQEITAGSRQLVKNNARFFVLARLGKDEVLELICGERALAKKCSSVQVGFQADLPGFKLILRAPVSPLEVDRIERKASRGFGARRLIPSIRENHSSDIPK